MCVSGLILYLENELMNESEKSAKAVYDSLDIACIKMLGNISK